MAPACIVKRMIGTSCINVFKTLAAPRPFMRGMDMSKMIKSGRRAFFNGLQPVYCFTAHLVVRFTFKISPGVPADVWVVINDENTVRHALPVGGVGHHSEEGGPITLR